MKIKTTLISLTILLFAMSLAASSALAGSKQRYRWEGVAIGVGAAILGHAIIQSHRAEPQRPVVHTHPQPAYRPHQPAGQRQGHWEWRSVWVPPNHETVWNPGHYNHKGRWVPGHWIHVQTTQGHWTQARVWVARGRAPY